MKNIKVWVATKALVFFEDRILLLRESKKYDDGSNEGCYDVAGGRVKPGQRFDKSLLREVKEEAGLEVKIDKPFFVSEWRPLVRGEQWQIVGIFFICLANSDKVILGQDHNDYKWVDPKDYHNYPLTDGAKAAFKAYLQKPLP